jgi:hypothetical protein
MQQKGKLSATYKLPSSAKMAQDPLVQATVDQTRESSETASMPPNIESLHVEEPVEACTTKRGIHSLPQELLDHIFIHLDGPAPSSLSLRLDPSFDLTKSDTANLKSVSLVCHSWRASVIPILFRHSRLVIEDPLTHSPAAWNEDMHAPFGFINQNDLKPAIQTFTLCISTKRKFLDDTSLQVSEFWGKVFDFIDPLELTIVVSPEVMGGLTGCRVCEEHAWTFDMPYHLLQLKRLAQRESVATNVATSSRALQDTQIPSAAVPLRSSSLFESRPWTTLLINESSFMKAFTTYEFFHKSPPSILEDLVGSQTEMVHALIPPTVRDMSYIAVFPISTHFEKLTRNLPLLDRFYVQCVPRSNVLTDPVQMQHLEPRDLWLERNSCYALVMRELFNVPQIGNFQYLTEFESGDSADEDAWQMAVEYVKRSRRGWRVDRRGVFVKDAPTGDRSDGNPDEEETVLLSVQPHS